MGIGLIFDASAFNVEMALRGNFVLLVSIDRKVGRTTHLHIRQDVFGSQKTTMS